MQMQELDDNALLREYVERDSHDAFATLVARHVNKVYSVALRHTRNPSHAEEITQAVFVILAQKADKLRRHAVLSGWLYQAARFTAVTFIRSEIRRVKREQEACMQTSLSEPSSTIWEELSPLIDDAIGKLDRQDRDALVLRFFDGKSMREVGTVLGASEDAAKMRVNRAVEKLRKVLAKRGIHASTSILTQQLSANLICVAPAALIKTATAIALTKGMAASVSTSTLIKGALKIMAWTKTKTAILVTAGVLFTGTASVAIYNYNTSRPIVGIPKDWSVLSGDADQWTWADGKINAHSTNGDTILASNKKYHNVSMSVIAGTTNRDADIALRMQDANNGYFVLFVPDGTPWAAENGCHISVIKRVDGDENTLASFKRRRLPQSEKITVTANGSSIGVRLDDVSVINVNDTTFSSGFVGLRICGDATKPCDGSFAKLTIR